MSICTTVTNGVGAGVPGGGEAGQVLAKLSATSFDSEWIPNPSQGVPEAPEDGSAYVRVDATWVVGVTLAESDAAIAVTQGNLDTHTADLANPHQVTAAQTGAAPLSEVITDATTSRSLVLTDVAKYIRLTNAASCEIILVQDSDIDWPINSEIFFRVASTGVPTFPAQTNVTINNVSALLAENDTFCLKKITANTWDLI